MTRRERDAPLPDVMPGRWVSLGEPTAELIVSGGDVTCFGARVDYGFREEFHDDGALTVDLRPPRHMMIATPSKRKLASLLMEKHHSSSESPGYSLPNQARLRVRIFEVRPGRIRRLCVVISTA